MSNTEKTIEELEAEVMAELEEGMHDAPTKGAVPAEPMKKKKNVKSIHIFIGLFKPLQKSLEF